MTRHLQLGFVTFLTVVRFPLVLMFLAGAIVYSENRVSWVFALSFLLLVLSAFTDLFDGYLARKFGVTTALGAHVDPLMDKFFYLSTLPLLIYVATKNEHTAHAIILVVMTVLFLARDQWVTFLRAIGSSHNVSGKAHWSGKVRTATYFPLICFIYLSEEAPSFFVDLRVVYGLEALALVINFLSVYTYTSRYWPYLRKSASLDHLD
jgi:CDP-diacylglycerol--glycerol-3-phosphate 3-phosphatidyltransferase